VSLPVVYRTAARLDIIAAARDYEEQRPALGRRFLDEIGRIERHLSSSPGLYQAVEGPIRRAVLRRFPYGLFYLEETERVLVLACLDLHRDPEAITDVVGRR
jgi:plasmid stabilization system protein ParE